MENYHSLLKSLQSVPSELFHGTVPVLLMISICVYVLLTLFELAGNDLFLRILQQSHLLASVRENKKENKREKTEKGTLAIFPSVTAETLWVGRKPIDSRNQLCCVTKIDAAITSASSPQSEWEGSFWVNIILSVGTMVEVFHKHYCQKRTG